MMRKSAPGEEGIQVKKGTFWKSMEGKTRNNYALWFPFLRHLGGLLLGVGFLMKEKEIFVKFWILHWQSAYRKEMSCYLSIGPLLFTYLCGKIIVLKKIQKLF